MRFWKNVVTCRRNARGSLHLYQPVVNHGDADERAKAMTKNNAQCGDGSCSLVVRGP